MDRDTERDISWDTERLLPRSCPRGGRKERRPSGPMVERDTEVWLQAASGVLLFCVGSHEHEARDDNNMWRGGSSPEEDGAAATQLMAE
jgi:hypothetical protein